ncbi:beta-1,4 N-acetylgalactosaminyltransferase 1-like [Glandiceps talaboti]
MSKLIQRLLVLFGVFWVILLSQWLVVSRCGDNKTCVNILGSDLIRSWQTLTANSVHVVDDLESEPNREPCECGEAKSIGLDRSAEQRRRVELADWRRQHQYTHNPLSMCEAFSPFRYPGSGVVVEPLKSTKLHGLALHSLASNIDVPRDKVDIKLRCRYLRGVLVVHANELTSNTVVNGNHTEHLCITFDKFDIALINSVLSNIEYRNTVYNIEIRDVVDITWWVFAISVHIHIKSPTLPILYDPGPLGDLGSMVTIITKTFERYDAVRRFIESVRKFYPKILIIVADDSQFPQKLNMTNIKHYIMPFAEGWFAGRSLALSQVKTKYFVWVDDDYIFTAGTRLERFINKFENPDLTVDLIAGTFGDINGKVLMENSCWGCRVTQLVRGDKTGGDCMLYFTEMVYGRLKKYPQCYFTDRAMNFFMGRTNRIRNIGFDPFHKRVGHSEFFFDSFGKIRMVSCNDVNIYHMQDYTSSRYKSFRFADDIEKKIKHTLFKNNLRCYRL